jgi:hypothetical protein
MPWQSALAVFIGTLPVFGVLVWNLVEVKTLRTDIGLIKEEITKVRERLARIEQRLDDAHIGSSVLAAGD